MTPLQFKVTNKAEYDDLMQKCEKTGYKWMSGYRPTQWSPLDVYLLDETIEITLYSNKHIEWCRILHADPNAVNWQIGQPIPIFPLSTLEAFCAIPENPDGSITIPSTLAVAIVKELRS